MITAEEASELAEKAEYRKKSLEKEIELIKRYVFYKDIEIAATSGNWYVRVKNHFIPESIKEFKSLGFTVDPTDGGHFLLISWRKKLDE